MKKLAGRLVILGALIGGVVALRGYAKSGASAREMAQITFDDGSSRSLSSGTPEGDELADIARKLVGMGV